MGGSPTNELLIKMVVDSASAVAGAKETETAVTSTVNRITNLYGASADQLKSSLKRLTEQGADLQVRLAGATDPALVNRLNESFRRTETDITLVKSALDKVDPQAITRTGNQLRQAQASAMILERQFGVHMPRAINTMLARSELIGPLLQGAFAIGVVVLFIENLDKIYEGIKNASLAIGGFGEASRKAFEENVKASGDALTHFQGLTTQLKLATGHFLLAQTQARLASLELSKATVESAMSLTKMFVLLGAAAGTYGLSLVPVIKSLWNLKNINDEIAKLQQRHIVQTEELGKLEKELGKEHDKNAKAEDRRFAAFERHAEVELAAQRRQRRRPKKLRMRRTRAWKQVIDKEIELRQQEKDWGDFHMARLKEETDGNRAQWPRKLGPQQCVAHGGSRCTPG